MGYIVKYENLHTELPKLQTVLLNTIQSECLEIKSIDKTCKKYINNCSKIPKLTKAHYVVYSKYIAKENHKYEKFIFLDNDGLEICDVSGVEMELYGILNTCENLFLSEEYKHIH
ncbi:hypothetical protein JHD49_04095 [Sulfurimonas sp. SAG-AH-194-C21]|nr:hypothetical protein [Sulfurimonas sp. SAG-AH-194-C21]MDF1883112.1 hypothetical protein [Sulfurimonas sp. SAG-AH-194-C21]